MKKFTRILSLILALLLMAVTVSACGKNKGEGENKTSENKITITVKVVDDKGETTDFTIETNQKYLRGALEQEKLVEGEESQYGLYIHKVNGLSAVYEKDNAYWAVYEGDEMAATGIDQIELKDGGVYKLVYTKA